MNAADIISRFPSLPELAKQIGEDRQLIDAWVRRNSIPPERTKQLLAAAEALDVKLEATDFNKHWLEVARNKAGAA